MTEAEHDGPAHVELAPGDGCVVMRADGTCQFLIPAMAEDEHLSPDLVLLTSFALGIGVRDQRLLDVLAVIMEERRAALENP